MWISKLTCRALFTLPWLHIFICEKINIKNTWFFHLHSHVLQWIPIFENDGLYNVIYSEKYGWIPFFVLFSFHIHTNTSKHEFPHAEQICLSIWDKNLKPNLHSNNIHGQSDLNIANTIQKLNFGIKNFCRYTLLNVLLKVIIYQAVRSTNMWPTLDELCEDWHIWSSFYPSASCLPNNVPH